MTTLADFTDDERRRLVLLLRGQAAALARVAGDPDEMVIVNQAYEDDSRSLAKLARIVGEGLDDDADA